MSLSYYYEFTAPASTSAGELEHFLHDIEELIKSFGFTETTILNAPFDTPERQEFSNRIGCSFSLQDDRLKGLVLPADGQIRNHDMSQGYCRLIPLYGVVVLAVDEKGSEFSFGFLKFPSAIVDIHGKIILETGLADDWHFRDFVNSPDPRFREIVEKFKEAGFVKSASDEYA